MKCKHRWLQLENEKGLYQKGVRETFGPLPIKKYICEKCGAKAKEWNVPLIHILTGIKLPNCGKEIEDE